MADLIVRRLDDRSEVHRVTISESDPTPRRVEVTMRGMLRNLSPLFFIDDSEFDDIYASKQ
jgi:hypothetical protein